MPDRPDDDSDRLVLDITIPAVRVVPGGNPASPVAITTIPVNPATMLTPTTTAVSGLPTFNPTLGLPGPFHFEVDVPIVPEEIIAEPTRTSQNGGAKLPDEVSVAIWVQQHVEGEDGVPQIVAAELVTLRTAMVRDQRGEWRSGATGDPDNLVWEVEVRDAVIAHSCFEAGKHCYWDSRVFVLDAETGEVVGQRNPPLHPEDATPVS